MSFDREKFKRLVHYVCHRCGDPRKLGAVKLNKILWFSEMFTFERTGLTLTGETYVKRQRGPAPKHVLAVLDELESENQLCIREPESQYEPRMFFAKQRPDLAGFTPDDISVIDALIAEICENHTAASISDATHDAIYELAQMGEEIPPYAFLASRMAEIGDQDLRWAQQELANASDN